MEFYSDVRALLKGGHMKVILSRKGFDSGGRGGIPSPILPSGEILSLPIPNDVAPISFSEVRFDGGKPIVKLIEDLSESRQPTWSREIEISKKPTVRRPVPGLRCHLDPDLRFGSLPNRLPNWRPAFGQHHKAQRDLSKWGVGQGDIFLFFGWSQHVQCDASERWSYVEKKDQDKHVIFGWLQVERRLDVDSTERANEFKAEYPWLKHHPHLNDLERWTSPNAIYLPSDHLTLPNEGTTTIP
jgi:hypothetical protein